MKITKTQLQQIIKEELGTFLNEETSEDVMNRLKALGWDPELADVVGTIPGHVGLPGHTPEQRKEHDRVMENPEVLRLLKKYADLKKPEYEKRMQSRSLRAADGTTPWDLARDLIKNGILELDHQRRRQKIQTAVLDPYLSIIGDDGPDWEDAVWNAIEQSIPDTEGAQIQENKMKITKARLTQIIKEELALIAEQPGSHDEPPYNIMPMADIEAAFKNARKPLPPYDDLMRMQSKYENTPGGRDKLANDVRLMREDVWEHKNKS